MLRQTIASAFSCSATVLLVLDPEGSTRWKVIGSTLNCMTGARASVAPAGREGTSPFGGYVTFGREDGARSL